MSDSGFLENPFYELRPKVAHHLWKKCQRQIEVLKKADPLKNYKDIVCLEHCSDYLLAFYSWVNSDDIRIWDWQMEGVGNE